jgi:hypothetical protein
MGRLNKNNFLIWDGDFDEAPFSVIANTDSVSMSALSSSVTIFPFQNDIATYGINPSSFTLVSYDNILNPPIWNQTNQSLTYFLADGATSGLVRYRFRDTLGNLSNIADINISVTARATIWVGHEASKVCLKDSNNNNTGQAFFNELREVYSDNGESVLPLSLKANTEGESDYIAPFSDSSCSTISGATYSIRNFTTNQEGGTIVGIGFFTISGTLLFSQNLDIRPNQNFTVTGPSGNLAIRVGVSPRNGQAQVGFNVSLNNTLFEYGSNSQTYEFFDVNITESVNTIIFQSDV